MNTDWENQLILGRFRVDVRLPGDGESYRAWDNQTKQVVSLHLLPETDDESRRKLESSVRDLERVAHPGILPYLGLFELSGQSFWAEGYMDGPTLRYILNASQGETFPLGEVLIYIKSLSSELAALHQLGWVHGNLGPEAVRLGRDGRIYLAGMFAARRIEDGFSTFADIFGLASILYEMLTGVLPNHIPYPDLRELNPSVPEFLARTLPRALDESVEGHITNPTEFFLMACLASHIEGETLPDRIGSGISSLSAKLIEGWNYLPPMAPPPVAPKALERDRNREAPNWLWWLLAAGIIGLGLVSGYFFAAQSQSSVQVVFPTVPGSTPSITAPVSSPPPTVENVSAVLPTDTVIPTLDAPDGLGGRIVFTCSRSNSGVDLMQLCMVLPTGKGGVARITGETAHDFYPAFSPNGKSILFASNRGGSFDLYLKTLQGDTLTQLTNGVGNVSSASFSRDGKTIAFSNSVADGKPSSLWTVDADGKHVLMLYEGTGNIASPVWSPNGRSIAFVMSSPQDLESYEVYIYDLDAKNIAPVTKGHLSNTGGSVDWSPDGRFLLLFAGFSGHHEIYRFDLVTEDIVKLTDGGNNWAPSYSPDGKWIVFNSMRATPENANIFIMRADGSDVRQLTQDIEPDWQPRWGPP